jgi:hypothetical protein
MLRMHSVTFHEMDDGYIGLCLACKEPQENCEPDAHKYTCESCGENAVYGVSELLLMGELEVIP